jgi:hypothetical protein
VLMNAPNSSHTRLQEEVAAYKREVRLVNMCGAESQIRALINNKAWCGYVWCVVSLAVVGVVSGSHTRLQEEVAAYKREVRRAVTYVRRFRGRVWVIQVPIVSGVCVCVCGLSCVCQGCTC